MSAYDWAAIVACCLVVVAFSYYTNRPSDGRKWQDSTGSEPQTAADDDAEQAKAAEIAQLEAWLRTPAKPRNTIPQQRQPRKDQP